MGVTSSVYEGKYQRRRRIRTKRAVGLTLQFLFGAIGMITLVNQFVIPILLKAKLNSFTEVLNDMLSLCIPVFGVWLLFFYTYFHCWLGLKAELVGIDNKEFYKDWWNADSIVAFWERWNLPLREWSLKHLYSNVKTNIHLPENIAVIVTFLVKSIGT